jgi:hypothetical protein
MFGSKKAWAAWKGGDGWEQVEKQVVETMTYMAATGKCVREYGCVSG